MRIAIDVDEVLRNTMAETVKVYNQLYSDNITLDHIKTWDLTPAMTKCPDPSSLFKKYPEFIFSVAKPHEGAIDFVKSLEADGHDIWIVTHQFRGVETHTLDWLHEHNIPYHSICFTKDKYVVGCDVLVDDGVHNLEAYQQVGTPICIARPWNQHWTGHRVHNFEDAYKLINSL